MIPDMYESATPDDDQLAFPLPTETVPWSAAGLVARHGRTAAVGVKRFCTVPSPSLPWSLAPQQKRFLLLSTAQVCRYPENNPVMLLNAGWVSAGVALWMALRSPSCPKVSRP